MPLYSGQGKVFAAPVVSGAPGAFIDLANVPALNLQFSTTVVEHQESTSGQRLVDGRLITKKDTKFSADLEEFSAENFALGLYGQSSVIAAGTVTAEALPTGLMAGDSARLAQQQVSAVTVKDSAATPATLVLGTDYTVDSAATGRIKFLNVGAYLQPFKVDYSYAGGTNVNMFTQPAPERWLRFEGLNTADSDKPVLIEIYRAVGDPFAQMDLISQNYGKFTWAGSALYDATKVADAVLGQFGRVIFL